MRPQPARVPHAASVAGGMVVTVLLAVAALPAATPRIDLDEIEPGMRGVGVTVFSGTAREEFGVEVLGVINNVMGPRRSLIIVRLDGGPLAETGVIQGMSGSPVYFDERLAGALSYSLGSFAKEPIAGITPIGEMVATDAAPMQVARRRAAAIAFADGDRVHLAAAMRRALARTEPFAGRPDDVRATGLNAGEAARLGTQLRPIATPVLLSGFVPEVIDLWANAFDGSGFVTTIGGAAAGAATQSGGDGARLEPGDAVGATLMRGDFAMTGTGTVTLVDEDRVYAFGHPFYNLGRASLPMTRARITTVLPSLAISSKITTIGDTVGTIDQDRSTGIYGSLGGGPTLIPIDVTIAAADRELTESFAFEVIEDPFFTPTLALTGLLNTLLSWTEDLSSASTLEVTGAVHLRDGHDPIRLHNVYAGNGAALSAAVSAAAPLSTLLGNRFLPVEFDRIELGITTRETPRIARLERVRVDTPRPRAGDTLPVTVSARTAEGELIVETVSVRLPRDVTGPVQILVADAETLQTRDASAGRQPQQARSLTQLIRALNRTRQQDRFYVQLLAARPGAVVRGQPQVALPSSVRAVLDGDRAGGDVTPLSEATLGEWDVPTGHVVSGSRLITLTVEPAGSG
ncbi:MAG: hypothetical protein F4Z04_16320 [Acidobacteria bacterium]|nr:hypothetical protein [Acidobacteriota bacterium]